MRTRRRFTAEFKETAVQWLASSPVADVARMCEVSVSVLHRWRRKLDEHVVKPAEGRRRFTKEFKASAVEQVETAQRQGKTGQRSGASQTSGALHRYGVSRGHGASHKYGASIAQVAAALGVRPNTLHRWRKEAREFGGQAFSGYGKSRAASEPGRAIKISLRDGEYERVREEFENSSARSLPDFTRSRLLESNGEEDVEALERMHAKIDELADILRRMAWIYGATCDSRSHAASSGGGGSGAAGSHPGGFAR